MNFKGTPCCIRCHQPLPGDSWQNKGVCKHCGLIGENEHSIYPSVSTYMRGVKWRWVATNRWFRREYIFADPPEVNHETGNEP